MTSFRELPSLIRAGLKLTLLGCFIVYLSINMAVIGVSTDVAFFYFGCSFLVFGLALALFGCFRELLLRHQD
jgi:hypothetical protein